MEVTLIGRPMLPWVARGSQYMVATKACHVPDTPEDIHDPEVTKEDPAGPLL